MRIKYKLTNITTKNYLSAVLYPALLVLVGALFSQTALAKMDYSTFMNKVSKGAKSYCAEVNKVDSPFREAWYDDCIKTYTDAGPFVYYATSQNAINQAIQSKCSVPTTPWTTSGKSPCGAYAESATKAQAMLKQSGDSKPDKPKPKPKPKPDPDKPPPITECNGIKDAQDRKDCKKEYRACNKEDKPKDKQDCKKETIQKHKKKQADKEEAKKKKEEENKYKGKYLCGNIRTENNGTSGPLSDDNYYTKFNFGCVGEKGPKGLNPIEDLAFAVLRFLSVGVGIAVVIAVIGAGIQYTASEGNAEVTTKAKKRIRSAIIGLLVYIFAFSLFQYLVPGGIFSPGTWINLELITRLL